jgi:uncharacterized protein YgbK (DUF1537 family)
VTWELAVVADDLTGANDTAVQFARAGWPTLVALTSLGDDAPGGHRAGVVALTTDARAARAQAAQERTGAAVRHAMANGVRRLYLKVDSTMRGSVAAQVAGALDAWRAEHPGALAVLCPAYPAMGRTVRDGSALVGGRPLEEGAPGRDPVTPVGTSVLAALVPGARHVTLPEGAGPAALAEELATAGSDVVTVDAEDDKALALLAAAVECLGPRAIPVGSAGLAAALATQWAASATAPALRPPVSGAADPTLVLVSSLNPVAREQERRVVEEYGDRLLCLKPPLDGLLDGLLDGETFGSWCNGRASVDTHEVDVLLVSAPEQRGEDAAERISARLADVVAHLHSRIGLGGVVVTGGDGARALVDRWGSAGIAVHDAVREGMPYGVLVGGDADGLPIITKAGGFGAPDALVLAIERLTGVVAGSPRHT